MSELTWDNTYLLGWYDANGKGYLTTWASDLPMVDCVVTGRMPYGPPMWNAAVPSGATLHPLPPEADTFEKRIAYATSIGGVLAFGWKAKVNRKPSEDDFERLGAHGQYRSD